MAISSGRSGAPVRISAKSELFAAAKIVIIPLILLVALFYWNYEQKIANRVTLDLCSATAQPPASTALLIDRTDPLSPEDKKQLHNIVRETANTLIPGERFSVLAIDGTLVGKVPSLLWSYCTPGTAATINELTKSASKTQVRFDTSFMAPLDKLIDDLKIDGTSPDSPIIETIQSLTLLSNFSPAIKIRKLVIFSDMLQNSTYSQYNPRNPATYVATVGDARYKYIATDLTGVVVQVYYLPRPRDARFQGTSHIQWWHDFFMASTRDVSFSMVARSELADSQPKPNDPGITLKRDDSRPVTDPKASPTPLAGQKGDVEEWGSSFLNLAPPRVFDRGTTFSIRLRPPYPAEVAVRLLPLDGPGPGTSAGLLRDDKGQCMIFKVNQGVVTTGPLSQKTLVIKQISVHGFENAFNQCSFRPGNPGAYLTSVVQN